MKVPFLVYEKIREYIWDEKEDKEVEYENIELGLNFGFFAFSILLKRKVNEYSCN